MKCKGKIGSLRKLTYLIVIILLSMRVFIIVGTEGAKNEPNLLECVTVTSAAAQRTAPHRETKVRWDSEDLGFLVLEQLRLQALSKAM